LMGGRCPPKDEIRTLRDSDRTGDVLKTRKEFARGLLWPLNRPLGTLTSGRI
jgi:hypothetical protein